MSNQQSDSHHPAAAQEPPAERPDNDEAAWDRVLDCGAPGPARAEPALFYQERQRLRLNQSKRPE